MSSDSERDVKRRAGRRKGGMRSEGLTTVLLVSSGMHSKEFITIPGWDDWTTRGPL